MTNTILEQQIQNLYPHLSEEHINLLIDKAKGFYFNLRYPYGKEEDFVNLVIPKQFHWWIVAAIKEFSERGAWSSATSYKENRWSVSWSNQAHLSDRLISLITPMASAPS